MSEKSQLQKAIDHHRGGRREAARQAYQSILKKNRDSVSALHFYGVLLYEEGQHDKAIKYIRQALKISPDYFDAHNNLGNIYLEGNQVGLAKEHYESALKYNPKFADAHSNLGVLLTHLKELPQAERHLATAIELQPGNPDTHANLATTYLFAQRGFAAEEQLQLALDIDPTHNRSRSRLGQVLYALDKRDAAISLYREWLEREPGNALAEHYLAAFGGAATPDRSSDAYVEQTFDNFADSFDRKLESLGYRVPQKIAELFEAPDRDSSNSSRQLGHVLDLGCGTGLCGPILKPRCLRLTGVDLSQRMLNRARQRNCYDELVHSNLEDALAKYESSVDAIVAADVLIYLGCLENTFKLAKRAMVSGARFYFSLENARESVESYRLEPHGRYVHNPGYVESLLEQTGFVGFKREELVVRQELGQPVDGLLFEVKA